MLERIKGAAKSVKDKVGGLVGGGLDTLKGQVEELSDASPALAQLGYHLAEIDLELGILPRVVVHLGRDQAVTDEAFQAVLANHAEKRTFCILVGLLRQANALVDKVQFKGRCLSGVEVSLGLPPSLKLKYT
jgi:hypothetical protein